MTLAGFTLTERLAVDPFGELWAARGPGGTPARARRIDPALAQHRVFADTFLAVGDKLRGVEHPNLVTLLAVGRDDQGALVVVHEDVDGAVMLDQVLRDARLSGVRPPRPLAVHIARQVVKALERAHRAGVVHAGVHPRSVMIDGDGGVRLTDFASARALAAAAAEDDSLLRGQLGYVAPEIALGDRPDERSDVFAAAALLHELYTGSPPPGLIDGPGALANACERALHTDANARYADAGELAAALAEAARDLGPEPKPRDVAKFVTDSHGGANRSLDAETEDMLAGLDVIADVDHGHGHDGHDHTPLPAPMPDETRPSGRWPAHAPLPLPAGADSAPVQTFAAASAGGMGLAGAGKRRASAPVRIQTADVISERIVTPTPLPTPAPTPSPAPRRRVPERTPAPADLVPEHGFAPAVPAFDASLPSPLRPPSIPPVSEPTFARGTRTMWLLALVAVGAAGVFVWKTGLLDPGKRRDEELAAEARAAAAARGAEVGRRRYADVVIDSDVPNAAVWMALGKTPVDSLPLSTASIYELRVEQDGFKAGDAVVSPARWTGSGDTMGAAVKVTLEPAAVGYVAPAAPPKTPPPEATGKAGRGRIHVDSDPRGAQVFLLVGFTPQVRVTNLATDETHEFKVMLDGHVPAFAVVAATDFMDPTGKIRPEVQKSVVLRARPSERTKDTKDRTKEGSVGRPRAKPQR